MRATGDRRREGCDFLALGALPTTWTSVCGVKVADVLIFTDEPDDGELGGGGGCAAERGLGGIALIVGGCSCLGWQ
jgi:hypothetical protein